ncbi:MAG: putative membrane protein [Rhodobacteraceae bacterium HLUCCA12]|nr:MAG: putative membrane protein [Rhodobacteraceae bacterium HLUCCA12]
MPTARTPTFQSASGMALGLLPACAIAAGAMGLRHTSGTAILSPMLVAVLVGAGVRALMGPYSLPPTGLAFASRPVLRAGIVLLGLQVTLTEIAELGLGAFGVAALTLAASYLAIIWAGRLLGLPVPLTQLIAAGTAVCGASAVVAANAVARGSESDVGYAVASVTVFGTISMLALPLMAGLLGMDPVAYGIWAGASIHEVAQVTAASFQLGPEAGQVGTITKLARVMLLAPLVLTMALIARGIATSGAALGGVRFPWFVLGFVLLAAVNGVVTMPENVYSAAAEGATFLMATGLAAMGLSTDLRDLRKRGLVPVILGALGGCFVVFFALGAVTILL